jgi:NifU-like protein involved in Fe-S cluster formation
MIDDLYSAKLLKLAANLPRVGRLAAPDASVEKIAKLCGSRVAGRCHGARATGWPTSPRR